MYVVHALGQLTKTGYTSSCYLKRFLCCKRQALFYTRKAKVYATARKYLLFHDMEDGAKASAIVISLIETAKANGLNPFQYLYTLLLFMPDHKDSPAIREQLMPWSGFIKERCTGQMDTETYTPVNAGKLPV